MTNGLLFPADAVRTLLCGLSGSWSDERQAACEVLAKYAGQMAQEQPVQGNEAEIADAMDGEGRRRLLRLALAWGAGSDPALAANFVPPWGIIQAVALALLRPDTAAT